MDLSKYLKAGDRELLEPQFNEREIRHMEDVHQLMTYLDILTKVSLFLSLAFAYLLIRRYGYGEFYNILLGSILIIFIFLSILILFISVDFQRAFVVFHELLFTNDLWLLDPKTDLMIQMLPENFFSGMAINIARDAAIYLAIVLGIGWVMKTVKE